MIEESLFTGSGAEGIYPVKAPTPDPELVPEQTHLYDDDVNSVERKRLKKEKKKAKKAKKEAKRMKHGVGEEKKKKKHKKKKSKKHKKTAVAPAAVYGYSTTEGADANGLNDSSEDFTDVTSSLTPPPRSSSGGSGGGSSPRSGSLSSDEHSPKGGRVEVTNDTALGPLSRASSAQDVTSFGVEPVHSEEMDRKLPARMPSSHSGLDTSVETPPMRGSNAAASWGAMKTRREGSWEDVNTPAKKQSEAGAAVAAAAVGGAAMGAWGTSQFGVVADDTAQAARTQQLVTNSPASWGHSLFAPSRSATASSKSSSSHPSNEDKPRSRAVQEQVEASDSDSDSSDEEEEAEDTFEVQGLARNDSWKNTTTSQDSSSSSIDSSIISDITFETLKQQHSQRHGSSRRSRSFRASSLRELDNPKDAILEEYEYDQSLAEADLAAAAAGGAAARKHTGGEKWETLDEDDRSFSGAVSGLRPPPPRSGSFPGPRGQQGSPRALAERNASSPAVIQQQQRFSPNSQQQQQPSGAIYAQAGQAAGLRATTQGDAVMMRQGVEAGFMAAALAGMGFSSPSLQPPSQMEFNPEEKRNHDLLVMYLLSMGTDPVVANNIALSFAQQTKNAEQQPGTFPGPFPSFPPSQSERNLNSPPEQPQGNQFYSAGDQKMAEAMGLGDPRSRALRYSAPPATGMMPAEYFAAGAGPTWERFDQPGAVSMEGRAYGARYRPPPAQLGRVAPAPLATPEIVNSMGSLDEESGEMQGAALIEAKAVSDDPFGDHEGIVTAQATPLNIASLWKEKNVRRVFLLAMLVVIVIVTTVSVVVATGKDDGGAIGTTGFASPTQAPTMPPTIINEDYVEALAEISGMERLTEPGSPQRRAIGWLSTFDESGVEISDIRFLQRYVLAVLFYSTDGPNSWKDKENWLNPTMHECDWGTTVVCEVDPSRRRIVTVLDLVNSGLSGSLPFEIGSLGTVKSFRLAKNKLSGTLSPYLFNLTKLTHLGLRQNRFTGTIPTTINNSPDIKKVDLAFNQMEGELPDEIFDLRLMTDLDVGYNKFTGTINPLIAKLQQLNQFNIRSNKFYGKIPDAFDAIPKLNFILLDDNQLTGPIPELSGHLLTRQELTVSRNLLTGTLPSVPAGNLSIVTGGSSDETRILLSKVDVSHNKLVGTIPILVAAVPSVKYLDLSNNSFTGNFPAIEGAGLWRSIEYLDASYNQIEGPVPVAFPQSLTHLDFSYNNLTFGIPVELAAFTNLNYLNLRNNDIGGTIPTTIALDSLKTLDLCSCGLTGMFPMKFCEIEPETLNLADNNLMGPLPTEIGKIASLKSLQLQKNDFMSTIPSELGFLEFLQVLKLDDNMLTGTIPATLALLNGLDEFSVAGNDIDGSLPLGMCSLVPDLTVEDIGCEISCSCCADSTGLCS